MTDPERLALIREVYDKACHATESFENATGGFLVYLFNAIAGGAECEMFVDTSALSEFDEATEIDDESSLYWFLQRLFPVESHAVWQFINVHLAAGADNVEDPKTDSTG